MCPLTFIGYVDIFIALRLNRGRQTGETKIGHFAYVVFTDQDVGRPQIAMNKVLLFEIGHTVRYL